ncbi:hypothetical protein [Paraflavitalea speifideaquila]|uniref:hypothetical protein n=1 Tax=Paraflavitalea speifideaquila TaxID=3076558 RepID=UPI0028E8A718|nr:hypothetical protein [Paraflavitalea speifideiaquila]
MGDEHKTAANQWGFADKNEGQKNEEPADKDKDKDEKNPPKEPETKVDKDPKKEYREITYSELMRRRGFFESVSHIECPIKE